MESTSVDYVDTLVLSFSQQSETSRVTLDMMKETWKVLEDCVKNNSVKMIGLCDVDTQLFIQLYQWANVKPSIIQINLASCCVVPPELSEFCKENGIQLLTHSDPISKASILVY
jgi:glutamate--cysteine ligase regulatory subunit